MALVPYAEVGCMTSVMMAAGMRMPYLCKGTSQRVPGMRVGEGAAFLCFYDKFFCHFLPLFGVGKEISKTNEPRTNHGEI